LGTDATLIPIHWLALVENVKYISLFFHVHGNEYGSMVSNKFQHLVLWCLRTILHSDLLVFLVISAAGILHQSFNGIYQHCLKPVLHHSSVQK
jgi:hypothetical protein